MSVILETRQLCKFYGAGENQVKAVNQVDIQIEQGEFVAIVGKSGSGKSTLLHMLGGLDTPTKGSVTLAGKDLYRMKEDALAVFRRRKIGFFSSRRRHTRYWRDWSSDVCSSDLRQKAVLL